VCLCGQVPVFEASPPPTPARSLPLSPTRSCSLACSLSLIPPTPHTHLHTARCITLCSLYRRRPDKVGSDESPFFGSSDLPFFSPSLRSLYRRRPEEVSSNESHGRNGCTSQNMNAAMGCVSQNTQYTLSALGHCVWCVAVCCSVLQ